MIAKDRERLRQLARQQLEYANSPQMEQCVEDWKALNNFRSNRPMIQLELGTFESELLPQRLQCESEEARGIEADLLRIQLPHTVYKDDKVVPKNFPVAWETWFHLFGHEITAEHSDDAEGRDIGHRFNYVIGDLEQDADKLGETKYGVNRAKTQAKIDLCEDAFGDILPVVLTMPCLYAVPTQQVVHMMGMENMMFAMYDYPDAFKAMMDRIADDYIAYFKWMQKEKLLYPTNEDQWLGQGSYCYTQELPGKAELAGREITPKDVWGFMDSQESVSISPEMFGEYIYPCYDRIAKEYGLLSYGCCEPVDSIWDEYLSKWDHLRKISISPWCNEEMMGERLQSKNVVYHRKPSPNFVGVGTHLDEAAVREHINTTLNAAKGCTLEFTQRDVYTIAHDEEKARRYIKIIRECIEENWQP